MLLTLTGDIDLERKRRSGGRRANSERSTAKINQLPQRSVANPYSPMELANSDQIEKYKEKTGVNSAVVTATGKIDNVDVVLAIMNFEFIGGSMGSVVGHKIGLAIDKALSLIHI